MKMPAHLNLGPTRSRNGGEVALRSGEIGTVEISSNSDSAGQGRSQFHSALRTPHSALESAFTMVEIAICLGVIGFALVAIIGVLPIGMSVQKENREETVINFDANYLMDALRSGAQGMDNLTNYVIGITNVSTLYDANGNRIGSAKTRWYTTTEYCSDGSTKVSSPALTNGFVILGLLSQPKYIYSGLISAGSYWSNYITADFRAVTGSPIDQGTSQSSKDFAFTYRVTSEVMPSAAFPLTWFDGTNENFSAPGSTTKSNTDLTLHAIELSEWQLAKNLQGNLTELRLRFRWPVLPQGKLGTGNQVYRTSASGQLTKPASNLLLPPPPVPFSYYLIQPQSYAPQ